MKSFTRRIATKLLLLSCITLLASAGFAGDDKKKKDMSPEEKAMMDAYMKAATPGKEHKLLAQDTGTWKVRTTEFDPTGKVVKESKAKAVLKSVLGGRFVEEDFRGDMAGMRFEGRGLYGYDNVQKKYVSSWSDNMGTGIMLMTGTYDEATKTFTYTGSYMDPVTNQMKTMKLVTNASNKKKRTTEFYDILPDGKTHKMMEMNYTR